MKLKVEIDDGACMGAGECIARAPDVFQWNSTKTQARVAAATAEDESAIREAADSCPNFAISVHLRSDDLALGADPEADPTPAQEHK
jgi:ferredoxin